MAQEEIYTLDTGNISDSRDISTNNFKRWYFSKSLISNFSFEDDCNFDGIADNWTDSNVTGEIINEYLRFHVQKLTYSSGGYIQRTISGLTAASSYKLQFETKGKTHMRVLINDKEFYHIYIDSENTWFHFENDFTFNATSIVIKFYNDSDIVYLDNVILNLVSENISINPTSFNYEVADNSIEQKTIDNEVLFIEPIDRKITVNNISPMWALVDVVDKEFFDGIVGEKVLIRAHTNDVFTVKIKKTTFG